MKNIPVKAKDNRNNLSNKILLQFPHKILLREPYWPQFKQSNMSSI